VDLRTRLADLPAEEGHAPGRDAEYVDGWGVFAVSSRLPVSSWRPRSLVRARERIARCFGMGDLQLQSVMPSGHTGRLVPEQMFLVDRSAARLDDRDLGRPVRLQENPSIGDLRLPARGVLVKAGAEWDILDPVEYARTRAQTPVST
jgi:hypothetical protein